MFTFLPDHKQKVQTTTTIKLQLITSSQQNKPVQSVAAVDPVLPLDGGRAVAERVSLVAAASLCKYEHGVRVRRRGQNLPETRREEGVKRARVSGNTGQ